MKIKPLLDYLVIEPLLVKDKTESGIFLPDIVEKEAPEQGKIIAIGPGKRNSEGKLLPIEGLKVGQTVLFTKYAPNKIKIDQKDYLVIRQDDVLGIIE